MFLDLMFFDLMFLGFFYMLSWIFYYLILYLICLRDWSIFINFVIFIYRFYLCLEVVLEYFRFGVDKIFIGSDVVYVVEEYFCLGV